MIPDDIRRFVLTSIPSVPYLEATLLFQSNPTLARTGVEVARLLYLPEHEAGALIEALRADGILQASIKEAGAYEYMPRDQARAAIIERLALAYGSDTIGITHLIHDSKRVDAQRFADAFKLRKDR